MDNNSNIQQIKLIENSQMKRASRTQKKKRKLKKKIPLPGFKPGTYGIDDLQHADRIRFLFFMF